MTKRFRTQTLWTLAGMLGAALGIAPMTRAAELVLPQNRMAFYASEPIEIAVAGLKTGDPAVVEVVPQSKGLATIKFDANGAGAMEYVLAPYTLAPDKYTLKLNGADSGQLTISSGINVSPMLMSATAPMDGNNFLVANSFAYGLLDANGMPVRDPRGKRSTSMQFYDNAVAKNIPSLCYMYWTGYVTHKPWGVYKSWGNVEMNENMRLFNLHNAQWLRRFDKNIISVGTLDEPGLAWGKTPAGGSASGFPNWDEAPWYESHGWKYTNDIASGSDADWMKYMTIRAGIMKQNNAWAKEDLKSIWPSMTFATDLYAPSAIMDGTDPLNQQVNDIPTSHVFMDWGTGKLGIIGGLYLEKSHNPTSKIAHAMNGQLFSSIVPQPQQRDSYRLMVNGMLAAGLYSNWWLNPQGMNAKDLGDVSEPALRIGPLFDQMTPGAHDVAVLWSFTELAMRQKSMAAKEASKKDGEQIKMMVASWPESTQKAGSDQIEVNAYNIGENYKEQVLMAHQALVRAGYPSHIIHEKLLPGGILRNYKTLVIVGQTFALPADVQKALADFVAAGGRIVTDKTTTVKLPNAIVTAANLTDIAFRWSTVFSLDAKKVGNKEASYYQTNYYMDDPARNAAAPMKAALQQTKAVPAFTTDSTFLGAERHVGGEGSMTMVINSYEKLPELTADQVYYLYNYAPYTATYTLQGIKPGSAVYCIEGADWKQSSRVTNFTAPQTGNFAPGEMKLYLVAPRAPSGLTATAKAANGLLDVTAGLRNLKMPWPLVVTVSDAAGNQLYRVYRATDVTGQFKESFPLGTNAAAGTYKVSVDSPVAGLSAQATADYRATAAMPSAINGVTRAFDEDTMKTFLHGKPSVVIAIGTAAPSMAMQQAEAQKLATALKAKGLTVRIAPESELIQKARYPRVWDPYINVYQPTGEDKKIDGMNVKTNVTVQTPLADNSELVTDADGKPVADWRQPGTMATVNGTGFIDYTTESFYAPGVKLYVNDQKQVVVAKGNPVEVKTTDDVKQKWSRPWAQLTQYVGTDRLPPELPEAYSVNEHLILLGDSTQSDLVAALQASELLPQVVDAKYPGTGKALLSFAWSPFALGKNVILVGASDPAGMDAGIAKLAQLAG